VKNGRSSVQYSISPFGWACAFGLMNLLAFGFFGWDKHRARTGGWRVPERTLLSLALFGGSVGAKLAQRRFRHKTRKQPFAAYLNAILFLHMISGLLVIYPPAGQTILTLLRNVL
jgi:uncharacterized membrane protein YsdA (DUF1294 family)